LPIKTIRIKRYFVKLLLARNLKLYEDHRQEHGVWTASHAHRYSVQFDPTTGSYEPILFNTNEGKYLDRRPGWKIFMVPVPSSK